jgi:outer membrane receptor protein involved in Fe transport
MAYARIASGYRPGGPNIGSPPGVPASFGPDRVVDYEVGLKGKIIPGVLTVDASLFQINWSKIQLQGADPVTSLTFIANGGTARSRGLELSANLIPWRGMSIDANLALTDAKLTDDILTLPGGVGFKGYPGDRLPFTARVAGTISAQQDFRLSARLRASLGATLIYLGNRPAEFQTNSPDASRPRILIPAYTVVNVRGSLIFDRKWTLTPYIRNLFDKRGISVADNRNGTTPPTALYIVPRTFGLTLARDF